MVYKNIYNSDGLEKLVEEENVPKVDWYGARIAVTIVPNEKAYRREVKHIDVLYNNEAAPYLCSLNKRQINTNFLGSCFEFF